MAVKSTVLAGCEGAQESHDGRTPEPRASPPRRSRAETIPGRRFRVPQSFAMERTSVRTSSYAALDPGYSRTLSTKCSDSTPDVSIPDPTAAGFGELNAAGFPKFQYVRLYVRRDGTFVHGDWRNSPSDGLPTCRVISS